MFQPRKFEKLFILFKLHFPLAHLFMLGGVVMPLVASSSTLQAGDLQVGQTIEFKYNINQCVCAACHKELDMLSFYHVNARDYSTVQMPSHYRLHG